MYGYFIDLDRFGDTPNNGFAHVSNGAHSTAGVSVLLPSVVELEPDSMVICRVDQYLELIKLGDVLGQHAVASELFLRLATASQQSIRITGCRAEFPYHVPELVREQQ
jgi:hypothetical protein